MPVDVVTSTVVNYTASALTDDMADGEEFDGAQASQILSDLRSLNSALNGSTNITQIRMSGTIAPSSNGGTTSGTSSLRWSTVYGQAGNFSGSITLSSGSPNVILGDGSAGGAPFAVINGGSGTAFPGVVYRQQGVNQKRVALTSGGDLQFQQGGATPIMTVANTSVTTASGVAVSIGGALDHDGTTIGFFGVAPTTRASAYTPTNVTTDRSYDADTVLVAELADVVGTLIADLQAYGLLQ